MPKLRAILVLSCCLSWGTLANAADERWTILTDTGVDYQPATGRITLTNGVTVKYGGATLTANRMRLDQTQGDAVAEGAVRLEREGKVWLGERIAYNFKTEKIVGENFRAGQPPYFTRGEVLTGDVGAKVYVLAEGLVTTDDLEDPGYRIRARMVTIVPGDYIECENATVYLGDVPVFWWPKFKRSLKPRRNHWVSVPGYRNKYGAFLLSTYEWYWDERLKGAVHVDERILRGPGAGVDLDLRLPKLGEADFKYYYTHDKRPGRDAREESIDENRQRVWFTYLNEVRTNLSLRGAVRYQSDSKIIHDFFESEFRGDPQPSTFVELDQQWSNWSLDLLAQPRVNEFQETVERLPDIKLTGLRQQIGPTPLYYESVSTFGYYQREFSFTDTNRYSALRADTFHQLLMPWMFFDWLNVTPRVGGRYTHYGESSGPGADTVDQDRGVLNTGVEATLKTSRTWPGVKNKFWEIDGIRHIVQPLVNYAYVPRPSVLPSQLPQFDYEQPTTQLVPFEFPNYNSIDSIDSQNVIRFGVRNKMQTKRSNVVENVVNWEVYADWRLRPRSDQETYSDLYSELELKPFHWLTLGSQIAYNLNDDRLDLANNSITIAPNDVWNWKFGNRYLREGAFFGTNANNLLFSSLYLRLSQNWGLRLAHYYSIEDRLFQHQYYSVYRDLRSFTAALTLGIRRSVGSSPDYGVAFTISSKLFPRYGLQDDINKPAALLGY